ncbi:MAG: hypothetical protein ACPLQP_04990, partial [Moorellaceae bacterium]
MNRMQKKKILLLPAVLFLAASLLFSPLVSQAGTFTWIITPEVEQLPLSTGVRYSAYRVSAPDYTEAVKVLTIDSADKFTLLETALSQDNLATELETPSAMAERVAREGKEPVAAINGDFYSTQFPYLPIGLQISQGELLISPQGFPALGITRDKEILLGTPSMEAWAIVTRSLPQNEQGAAQV